MESEMNIPQKLLVIGFIIEHELSGNSKPLFKCQLISIKAMAISQINHKSNHRTGEFYKNVFGNAFKVSGIRDEHTLKVIGDRVHN